MDNTPSDPGSRSFLDRFRPWFIGLAAVAVLAITILVVAAVTSPKDATRGLRASGALTAGQRAESLSKQAEQAARSGDTTEAATLAKQALATEPQNVAARKLLDRLESEKEEPATPSAEDPKPTEDPKQDPAPAPVSDPDAGFDKDVADLSKLLPASIEDYRPGTLVTDDSNAVLPFDPRYESRTVRTVLYSVHDRGTTAKARAFIDEVVKVAFPSGSPHEVSLPGLSRPAYFGTQGRVATVGFYRGRYAFEVSVTGAVSDANLLRALATDFAAKIPTKAP